MVLKKKRVIKTRSKTPEGNDFIGQWSYDFKSKKLVFDSFWAQKLKIPESIPLSLITDLNILKIREFEKLKDFFNNPEMKWESIHFNNTSIYSLKLIKEKLTKTKITGQFINITANRFYATLFEIFDPENKTIYWSYDFETKIFRRGQEPVQTGNLKNILAEYIHPQYFQEFTKLIDEAITTKKTFISHKHKIKNKKEWIWVEERLKLGEDSIQALSIDINDKMIEELKIKQHDHFLSSIIQSSPIIVYMKDINGKIVFANNAFESFFNIQQQKYLGNSEEELISKEVYEKHHIIDLEVMLEQKYTTFEDKVIVNSRNYYLRTTKFPILNDDKEVNYICTISTDITIQKEIELTSSQQNAAINRFAIFDHTTIDGKMLDFNENFRNVYGYSRNELLGHNFDIFNINVNKKDVFMGALEAVLAGKIWRGELECKTKTGESFWLDSTIVPIQNEKKETTELLRFSYDVTEKRLSEAMLEKQKMKLIQSSKMSTLGEMAGNIAHEINNPLTIIQAKAMKLKKVFAEEQFDREKICQDLLKIEETTNRIAKIIKGLRTFSRGGENDKCLPVKLKTIVDDVLELCSEKLKTAQIDVIIPDSIDYEIECKQVQIEQVFLNVINNAHDAIVKNEKKWIELSFQEIENFLEIKIVDSGEGIPFDIAEKIMQPFYTTKEIGKGTGLGLSISSAIIEEHHGHFWVDHNAKNTTFCILLPFKQPQTKLKAA